MADNYLIRLGSCTDMPSAGRSVGDLPAIVDSIDVRIWADASVIPLGNSGWIIGRLFTRTTPSRIVDAFEPAEADAIVASGGSRLLRHYWGSYVAIMRNDGGDVTAMRDPSGAMACFWRRQGDDCWLSSDARLLTECNSGRPSVDFNEVGRLLFSPDSMGARTCVDGIDELIPGEALEVRAGRITALAHWSPWDHVDTAAGRCADDAAAQLHDTLADAIGLWASLFPSALLGVSGGLDSSIVAACAANAGFAPRLLTMIGPDASGDESGYAQLLADRLDLPLDRYRYDLADIVIDRPTLPHLPWPVGGYFAQGIEAAHRAQQHLKPIDAFLTGNGGDNVFCLIASAAPLVDRLRSDPWRWRSLRTALDIARLTEASLPHVIGSAWRIARRDTILASPRTISWGLGKDVIADLEPAAYTHPWLRAVPDGMVPGKAAHVRMLVRAQKGHELYRRASLPIQIAPLLAQPVVEACLGIPSWQWIDGGRDRAIARMAAHHWLPDGILERRSKGGPDGFMQAIFRRNASAILSLLKGGRLAQQAIVNVASIEAALRSSSPAPDLVRRLLAFAACETWVRWWES